MGKKELRLNIKNRLLQLGDDRSHLDLLVSQNLKRLLSEFIGQKKLGVYSPILREPHWFTDFSVDDSYEYSLVHMGNDRELSYHPVELKELKMKKHHLQLDEQTLSSKITPEIVLVPGVAFTENLERLGRGKGFFDKYLSSFNGKKIGVFFDTQKVDDVFSQQHDEKLDFIVTDKEIIRGMK